MKKLVKRLLIACVFTTFLTPVDIPTAYSGLKKKFEDHTGITQKRFDRNMKSSIENWKKNYKPARTAIRSPHSPKLLDTATASLP